MNAQPNYRSPKRTASPAGQIPFPPGTLRPRSRLGSALALLVAASCSSSTGQGGTGGHSTGGSSGATGTGGKSTGGALSSGGATGNGGAATGGANATGGSAAGSTGSGGSASGGAGGRGGNAGNAGNASGGSPLAGAGGATSSASGGSAAGGSSSSTGSVDGGFQLPDLPPIPAVPAPKALGSVTMGDPAKFDEVKMDFPIASGPFQPTWDSIKANYPTTDSAWLRKAKFGIWVHFGPQAAGQSGDWYARKMYIEGDPAYNNHIRDFGHPSAVGYKELLHTWNPTALDPAALAKTYYDAGARFLIVQGVHHDQFDNWNSRYQPWNAMKLGPKRDILGEWKTAAHAQGMRFGVTFHHEYTWWWWQSAYRSDTTNAQGKLGVPYDAVGLTLANGVGKWWEGMDPRMLYTLNMREYAGIYDAMDKQGYNLNSGIFVNHLEFAHWYVTWWALRIMDVIENYDPDFIYTDGNSTQPFSGNMSGTGYKADAMQRVLAHYFNRTLQRRGSLDTFGIVKFNPNNRGIVNTFEGNYPGGVKNDQAWIGETPIGDWFYNTGFNYDPGMVIVRLLECVSRDGTFGVAVALKPDGSLDPGSVTQLAAVGDWMKINSAGIYGSHAWIKYGEGSNSQPAGSLGSAQANATFTTADWRFTVGEDGYLYAYCLKVPQAGDKLTITSLGTNQSALGAPIGSVALLGGSTVTWSQTSTGLQITYPSGVSLKTAAGFKIGPTSIIK
jgi:alpha-L-fucosidase